MRYHICMMLCKVTSSNPSNSCLMENIQNTEKKNTKNSIILIIQLLKYFIFLFSNTY